MAITANELRIGNYIKRCNKKMYHEEWYIVKPSYFTNNKISIFEPIPITEEWLLKFEFVPFKINGVLTHYRLGLNFIRFDDQDFYFELGKGMGIEIKYIHKLQNLYFALTGKELTYGNNPD